MAAISSTRSRRRSPAEGAAQAGIARFIAGAAGAISAELRSARPLDGGFLQENWLLDVSITGGPFAGRHDLVLRTDAPSGVPGSHGRAEEFALLRAAHEEGVTTPEPLFLCTDPAPLGRPFFLMRRVAGTARGERIVAGEPYGGAREALAERLGREMARIHAILPPRDDLGFLGAPPADPARARIAECRRLLDDLGEARPVLEWGLRFLERHAPVPGEAVLCHRDFRTGNYMVDETGLTAILDWEFAGWSDPHEDIGWFCSKSWRFGAFGREAGGVAGRAPFHRGYEAVSGRRVDPARARWWEAMASIRWAIIAIQQSRRALAGGVPAPDLALDLALTGHRAAEAELEILLLLDGWDGEAA